MKLLGLQNEVLRLFLIKSRLLGFWGIIRIIFGIHVSVIVSAVGFQAIGPGGTMSAVVTPGLLIFALAFFMFVGVVRRRTCQAGYKDESCGYPAV